MVMLWFELHFHPRLLGHRLQHQEREAELPAPRTARGDSPSAARGRAEAAAHTACSHTR